MRKILIWVLVLIGIIYLIKTFFYNQKEGFTPKIYSIYRPIIRYINLSYESFMNQYGPNVILQKLKKWNIF